MKILIYTWLLVHGPAEEGSIREGPCLLKTRKTDYILWCVYERKKGVGVCKNKGIEVSFCERAVYEKVYRRVLVFSENMANYALRREYSLQNKGAGD